MKRKTVGLIVLEFCLLLFFVFNLPKWNNLQVSFLSVGEGDAIYATYNDFDFLIDAGPNNAVLSEFGKKKNFFDSKLDFLLLTHPHDDHVVGAFELLEREEVGKVIIPKVGMESRLFQKIQKICEQKNIQVLAVDDRQSFQFGEMEIQIWPSNNVASNNPNDGSLIIKISLGSQDFLLTGDISDKTEEFFLENDYDLSAEVLKIAHHGSHYSSEMSFLQDVAPKYAVISVGKNSFGHPSNLILNRLDNLKIETIRTDLVENPTFETDGKTLILK